MFPPKEHAEFLKQLAIDIRNAAAKCERQGVANCFVVEWIELAADDIDRDEDPPESSYLDGECVGDTFDNHLGARAL